MTPPPSPNPLPTTEGLQAVYDAAIAFRDAEEGTVDLSFKWSALKRALDAAPTTEGVTQTCPAEYAHPFFVYDFMPQKIKFKSDRGYDSMALDVLQVRGWGHLTGHGAAGLRINHEAAAAIQDNFGKWVAKTLTDALTAPLPPPPGQ